MKLNLINFIYQSTVVAIRDPLKRRGTFFYLKDQRGTFYFLQETYSEVSDENLISSDIINSVLISRWQFHIERYRHLVHTKEANK